MSHQPVIRLTGLVPVARGYERVVYVDPTDPDRVIKVLVPDADQGKGGRMRRAFARTFAGYRTYLIRKEYLEYLRLALCDPSGQAHLPITHMFGFVQTDIGLGCSSQFVRDPSGAPAPTWASLCKGNDIAHDHRAAMTDFARRMLDMNVRASDLRARNIVLGHRGLQGEPGPLEAVLVDGFGDTHVIPIRSWSRWANTQALHRRFVRLAKGGGLTWSRSDRTFI
ncbi:YrbL family protein [Pseudooctadecabacter sp.]|uniref:YrbL family protein n=1 Tax=Pseudooctadecabacter sp. TaxID=1966338 RepID=UPI0025E9342D|nr:YrbL family protein [Pseudooctadecabacter sp.]